MKKLYKNLVISFIITLLIGVSCYGIYKILPQNKKYKEAFSQMNIGDSKEKVISTFEKSTKIENCHYINYSPVRQEIKDKCAEIHWYIGFLEEWGFVFDNEGKVVSKLYLISG